jgi:hypothetical protein
MNALRQRREKLMLAYSVRSVPANNAEFTDGGLPFDVE